MKQEQYDAINTVLLEAGIGSFKINPPLYKGEDVLCAGIVLNPGDILMDGDPRCSAEVAANALAARGLVRFYEESDAPIVIHSLDPHYIALVDTKWKRPPSSRRRILPIVGRRR